MCGIVGIFRTGTNAPSISPDLLASMRESMIHRGPDDSGTFVADDQSVGFAFRRLSIIDLSSTASQPMSNEDGSVRIVFNGEIYNHAELRPELEKKGWRFKTDHSDTEVLLKAYEEWGEECLPRLRGMFAFAVWDQKKEKIWLARDRMGVKPLYYTSLPGLFLFASEIKALLMHPAVPRACHETALYDFLTFLVSPAPQTLFDGIKKLPAGHTLSVDKRGNQQVKRYWNPFTGVDRILDLPEQEWIDRILATLRESIRYRMVSDVNFGVFLSGGIDSSTNVALMAEQMSRPVETFSIGFKDGGAFNELEYARMVVDRYKTNHHEIIISPEDLVRFLPKLVHHQDEPIVDPVCVPVYYVSKLAKDNGTTVCQVGEGADELFCGYPGWGKVLKTQPWANLYRMVPGPLRRIAWEAARRSPLPWGQMHRLEIFRRFSMGEHLFWGGAEAYPETLKTRLIGRGYRSRLDGYSSRDVLRRYHEDFQSDAPENADDLHWMTYLDLRFRLPELLLMRVDKMTMATAVEARVPFLDQEFIKLAMSIPQSMKFKNGMLKYLLKKAVEPILPHEIIYRKKQGFGVPVEDWFRGKLLNWAGEKIRAFSRRTDYFDPGAMDGLLRASGGGQTWFLLNFVLWYETWIEKKDPDLPI